MFPNSPYFIDGDKSRLEAVANTKALPPNPLKLFPAKNDTFTRVFFGVDAPKHLREVEKRERWLHADHIDPTFGISGDSQEVTVRRTYRRMQSNRLFMPLKPEQTSLTHLHEPIPGPNKNFVLVEESRLEELTKFENILREEKAALGEQCAWVLSDFHLDAHIPIPATRIAVQNLCETEMRQLAHEIRQLQSNWSKYSKQNHYDRPHLFTKDNHMDTTPLAHRAMKLRVIKAANDNMRQRRDRDTMQFEDEMSYFVGKYYDAQGRRRDYDRYFTLATRYGPLSKEEFYKDAFPGKRYYLRVLKGVLRLQFLWDRYWSVAKLRRLRSARRIQTAWRCHHWYSKLYPIIRLRKKVGKRSYLIYTMFLWKEYIRIVVRIKKALHYRMYEWPKICFRAWASTTEGKRAHRREVQSRTALRILNYKYANPFYRWRAHSRRTKRVRISLRRLFSVPHFDLWVRYTKFSKYLKSLGKKAAIIQAMGRMYLARKHYIAIKRARVMLQQYYLVVHCCVRVRGVRDVLLEREFVGWRQEELTRRANRANEIERSRLNRLQQLMQDKERAALHDIRKHIKTSDGDIQLREIASNLLERDPEKHKNMTRKQLYSAAKKSLIARVGEINRLLERHDYNAKHIPHITCADPRCQATFTTDDQYRSHVANDDLHAGDVQFADFHLMIKHSRGQTLVRQYLMNRFGIGKAVNCLDCWVSVQDWRKVHMGNASFAEKAVNIFDSFARKDAGRPLDIKLEGLDDIREKLEFFKNREIDTFYHKTYAKRSAWRYMLGLEGKQYRGWTDEYKLNPLIFDGIEWECFMQVFRLLLNDKHFTSSGEYLAYQEIVAGEERLHNQALFKEFKVARLNLFLMWAREYKQIESAMARRAYQAVDMFMTAHISKLLDRACNLIVDDVTVEARHKEQRVHEAREMAIDEAISFAEIDILEDIYEHYTRALIKSMWAVQDYRKGMMEYAGWIKPVLKKKLLVRDIPTTSASRDWFENFFKETVEDEKKAMGPDKRSLASVLIQRRIRGVLGRKRARKEFATTFTKQLDQRSQAYYYMNNVTGETSWTRPRIMKVLYPKSNW